MEITAERLRELERAEAKLLCLEGAGVEKWEWYDDALNAYRNEIEIENIIDNKFDEMLETLSSGVDEPAGSGCGYGFKDKQIEKAFAILKTMIADIQKKKV